MIRALLFDVDGTLVDSNDLHAHAWDQAFRHFGHDLPIGMIRRQIGKGGDNLIPALLPGICDEDREAIDRWRGDLFKRDYLPRVTPFPKVRELLEFLVAEGWRIALASSSSEEEVDYHLRLINAADLVHATASRSDVEHSKPAPDIFAAARAKVLPDGGTAFVIGDTPYDMEAAAKIGLPAIAVRSGGFSVEDLSGAVAIYDDPADLLARYAESPLARA